MASVKALELPLDPFKRLAVRVPPHIDGLSLHTEFRFRRFPEPADFRGQDLDIGLRRVFVLHAAARACSYSAHSPPIVPVATETACLGPHPSSGFPLTGRHPRRLPRVRRRRAVPAFRKAQASRAPCEASDLSFRPNSRRIVESDRPSPPTDHMVRKTELMRRPGPAAPKNGQIWRPSGIADLLANTSETIAARPSRNIHDIADGSHIPTARRSLPHQSVAGVPT